MSVNATFDETANVNVGETLRLAREAKGLTQQDLAQELCLQINQIDAIERDIINNLPELPFAVGFVRTMAAHLGLDSNALVTEFRAAHNMTDIPAPKVQDALVPRQRSNISLWATLAALVALVVLWTWFGSAASGATPVTNTAIVAVDPDASLLERIQSRPPLDLVADAKSD